MPWCALVLGARGLGVQPFERINHDARVEAIQRERPTGLAHAMPQSRIVHELDDRFFQRRDVERRARRLHDMMERLDVDGAALARLRDGEVYAEARASCLSCTTCQECLRWLDDPANAGSRPSFCPNLPLFEACKRK